MQKDGLKKLSFEELDNLLTMVLDEIDTRKFGDDKFSGEIIEPYEIKEYIRNKYAEKRRKKASWIT